MATSKKINTAEAVETYFKKLNHPLIDVITGLREIVLQSDIEISEQIKWNSLAYFYNGAMKDFDPKEYKRDLVVFNLHKKDLVLLVFPTGARVKDNSGILEGTFTDGRKIAKFKNLDDVTKRKKDLQAVIKAWIKGIDR